MYGNSYCGTWKDNLKHGFGVMKFADGQVYVGLWKNDETFRIPENQKFQSTVFRTNYRIETKLGSGISGVVH